MSFRAARVRSGFLEPWFLLLGRTARLCSATAEVSLKSQSGEELHDGKVTVTSWTGFLFHIDHKYLIALFFFNY